MAENDERPTDDLTEEASPHRLEEFRRRGQVAQSRELSALLALMAATATAYVMSPSMGSQLTEFMREVFRADLSSRLDLGSSAISHQLSMKALFLIIKLGLPVALAAFVMGVVGSFAQIGSIFTADPIAPDLDKVNPISGFQKIFSARQLVEGLRLALKGGVLIFVGYLLLKKEVIATPHFVGAEVPSILAAFGSASKSILFSLFGILAVFGAIDFGLQRWQFSKQLRMTKQEAKQEHKEREGDPMIRARIRAIQREVSRRRMMQAVKKATVVVTNPTHIAVALVYEKNMAAPRVVAKGADFLAQKIKKVAAEAGVPMVENVPLARTLYKTVKLNQFVPRALYQAVAEVLAYVYRLKNRQF